MQPHEIKTLVFNTINMLAIERVLDKVSTLAVTQDNDREEIIIDHGDERFVIGLTVRQERNG